MSAVIVEGNLRFSFGPSWSTVLKWDDSDRPHFVDFRKLNGLLRDRQEGTKAADIVALRDGELWFFEVKDFEKDPRNGEKRLKNEELYLEVALKVRDTTAGIVGLCFTEDARLREALGHIVQGTANPVHVVLWLEADGPPRKRAEDGNAELHTRMSKLKKRLRWLTPHALVIDRHTHQGAGSIPDLAVEFINRPVS